MPYLIAAVVLFVGIIAFFVMRSPVEAPSEPAAIDTAPTLAPGAVPEGFVDPTEPPPSPVIESEAAVEANTDTTQEPVDPVDDERTFTATASYFTPKRTEHEMLVSLTLKDRVVTAADVTYDGGAAVTPNHSAFDATYESQVIGKRLDEISLSRVGGASLTSEAFNEAVADIQSQS